MADIYVANFNIKIECYMNYKCIWPYYGIPAEFNTIIE